MASLGARSSSDQLIFGGLRSFVCVCGCIQTNAGSLSPARGTTNTRNTCRGVAVGKGNVH